MSEPQREQKRSGTTIAGTIVIALFGILVLGAVMTGVLFVTRIASLSQPPVSTAPQPQPTYTSLPTATPPAVTQIPPRGTYKHTYTVTEEFDRFGDKTVVVLPPQPWEIWKERPPGPGGLQVTYSYPGTAPTLPSEVYLGLVSLVDTWQYLDCHNLTLLLDGRVRMPLKAEHDGRVWAGSLRETVYGILSVNEFLQIVNAKKVEGQLCNTEFVLSTDQMEALRDLASRMQP